LYIPVDVGVPLILIVFADHIAVTPIGNPIAVPMPVTPVVACVMVGKTVLTHKIGEAEAVVTVLFGITVIVPVACTNSHPPVNGIV
jgi:hypothetical protein